MFKFTDFEGATVWIVLSKICSVEHIKNEDHVIWIHTNDGIGYQYKPSSDEDCRAFLTKLFAAMGEEYKYE